MRVAFDGACLAAGPITGVGRSFLDALAAYAAAGTAECLLLLPDGVDPPPCPGLRVVAAPRGALRRQLALPALLRSLGADLLHSPVAAVPLRAPCPTIATVHDLPWLHEELGEPSSAWRRFATRLALRAASAVIAPSAMTAADAARLLGDRGPPLHVVPHGTELGPAPDAASVARRRGPFLVLGDDRPRKNHARLRQAHALAARHCADLPPLAFVGPPGHYVDQAQKARLLADCRALVHGSLFEGFGLPVLEALAHGAPVACADLPPLREIAGDAATWFAPRDPQAIAAALLCIHTDGPRRERQAHDGHRRAAALTPEHTAARWRELHAAVLR